MSTPTRIDTFREILFRVNDRTTVLVEKIGDQERVIFQMNPITKNDPVTGAEVVESIHYSLLVGEDPNSDRKVTAVISGTWPEGTVRLQAAAEACLSLLVSPKVESQASIEDLMAAAIGRVAHGMVDQSSILKRPELFARALMETPEFQLVLERERKKDIQ